MGMAKMKVDKINLHEYNIIFFGYYDLSKDIFSKLEGMGAKILVIENDPANIELLKESKINYVYNSVTNPYFFNDLDFRKINLIVSNLIDFDDNIMIIKRLKKDNPSAHVIVTAKSLKDSLKLYDNDADYVIYPTFVNEQQVSVLLEDYTTDINKVLSKKIADIAKLKEKEEKQEHFIEIDSYLKKITQIKKPEKKEKDMGQNKLV
jgi:Trk K+ transport system NAD-binding subunit